LPVVGFLSDQSADNYYKDTTIPFLQGLKETGYVEGHNVAVEYRYAENQYLFPNSAYTSIRYLEFNFADVTGA
jgi:hypothetical protein